MSKIVLSGMQSSGILHLGNYIGAICNWREMIKKDPDYTYRFMIADLHSLTSLKNGEILRKNIIDASICYLACGVDFEKENISIFQQSKVKNHAELAWILQTITPMGWLERMTQFKDKTRNDDLSAIKKEMIEIKNRCIKFVANSVKSMNENEESIDEMVDAFLLQTNYYNSLDGEVLKDERVKMLKEMSDKYRELSVVAGKNEEKLNTGLLTYPTLMAADILLYNADFVPVGEDQKQHIEFTRDIAGKFNREYKSDIFKLPKPIISEGARIMSLNDGRKKMSKSDPSDLSRILLTDENDEISKKIAKAKTDSIAKIYFDKECRPEISNLLTILSVLKGEKIEKIEESVQNFNTKQFKDLLTEVIIEKISPIREKIKDLKKNFDIEKSLKRGNEIAIYESENLMKKVRDIVGI